MTKHPTLRDIAGVYEHPDAVLIAGTGWTTFKVRNAKGRVVSVVHDAGGYVGMTGMVADITGPVRVLRGSRVDVVEPIDGDPPRVWHVKPPGYPDEGLWDYRVSRGYPEARCTWPEGLLPVQARFIPWLSRTWARHRLGAWAYVQGNELRTCAPPSVRRREYLLRPQAVLAELTALAAEAGLL